MEDCACLCCVGSSRRCRCPQKCQCPAEIAAAEGSVFRSARAQLRRQRTTASRPRQKSTSRRTWQRGAGRGMEELRAPCPPPHCSLQGLPVEMLVEIFAFFPGTDLPSLALACTKFHHILHTDSIWRRRCREEYGVRENLQNLEMIGMSYREVYAKMFPYRNILGLWQLDCSYVTLLNVVVDGLCITGWTYRPSLNTHEDGPMQSEPSFRIRLKERKSPTVECVDDFYSFSHSRHLQIQKDRFSVQWIKRDHRKDSPMRLRGERVLVLLQEDRQPDFCLTYCRLYLPPSHPDDLIRPGLFHGKYDAFGLMIAMLSFHGKHARVTKITGDSIGTLEIHLMRRIQLRDGWIFRNFNEVSRVAVRGCSFGGAACSICSACGRAPKTPQLPLDLQDVFLWRLHWYLRWLRLPQALPWSFILFDENHLGFICLEMKYFILFVRVQNTFQNVEAPSPQAFLEMLSNIQSGPPGRSSLHPL